MGATASAISEKRANKLGLKIIPTKHKLVQIDESYLEVCGEVHTKFYRDDLQLQFSALLVKKMGFDIIGGINFQKENDIYCRMSKNKIIVKGIHTYNSMPYVATLNQMKVNSEEKKSYGTKVLVKCPKSETLLPGEYQFMVPISKRLLWLKLSPGEKVPKASHGTSSRKL